MGLDISAYSHIRAIVPGDEEEGMKLNEVIPVAVAIGAAILCAGLMHGILQDVHL
jgi:hypothetical protein